MARENRLVGCYCKERFRIFQGARKEAIDSTIEKVVTLDNGGSFRCLPTIGGTARFRLR
jgi:hypothetical protein